MYRWGQRGQTPAFNIPSPSFEILLIPQWNPSYIANFKLVKKAALTLPTLFVLKPTLWKWNINQGRKETWLDSPFYQFKGRKETWIDSPFIGVINSPSPPPPSPSQKHHRHLSCQGAPQIGKLSKAPFLSNPPSILVFCESPPKSWIFQWTPKIWKFFILNTISSFKSN